jgi:outer membrane protein assembly factor BamE
VALFEGDKLLRIDAAELPSEHEFVASISRPAKDKGEPPPLELTAAQRAALPAPPRPAAAAASKPEAVGPVRDYPPLEPM